ncbi:hypothetical protein OS493_032127 [Desmophyllum pertusum]|uniref:G-protein coupled receptors family 1 profile domain-containing protein n=1 Tax=Desmophyllum pertusum TaxID=174260 RepID=A0A9X0CHX9_9CNID|nr:hypothetical protein OS493_032127 [Desmophyllum pertusum]
MANLFVSNFTNVTNTFPSNHSTTVEGEMRNIPREVSYVIAIIINTIACPFTVLLNALVIMAVKRRPRLQTNSNIFLACLATTDVLTGLVAQPLFITWKCFYLLHMETRVLDASQNLSMRAFAVCSYLHLMLVTCERLIAIKFTVHYEYIVTKQNMKLSVMAIWAFTLILTAVGLMTETVITAARLFAAVTVTLCVLFIAISYVILYRETRRHEEKIKVQQLPQEEVERIVKESKALRTSVLITSAVTLSFLPAGLTVLVVSIFKIPDVMYVVAPFVRTFVMLNSLLNPLIYCLRQREMRKFVFKLPCQPVEPLNV